MSISKLYQVHNRFEGGGYMSHGIEYIVAETPEDAIRLLNLDTLENAEIYALEVTERTLGDEIKHRISLIEYWKENLDQHHASSVLNHHTLMVKHYEKILKDYVWRKTCKR